MKFKIGYNRQHKMFNCLLQVDSDKNFWMGGEYFERENIFTVINGAVNNGYMFSGFTSSAVNALLS